MSASRSYSYYYVPVPKKLSFGRTELLHITVAVLVLTFAFTLVFSDLLYNIETYSLYPVLLLYFFIAALVAVATGFLLHELAHKVLAQRYMCWAEFRYDRFGLLIALVTAFLGIVFAAPGAVYIAGRIDKAQNGKISLAGPMTNVALALAFMAVYLASPTLLVLTHPALASPIKIPLLGAQINLVLAGFNMIPFMPLDGAKIFRWNIGIYVAAFAAIIALGIYAFLFII